MGTAEAREHLVKSCETLHPWRCRDRRLIAGQGVRKMGQVRMLFEGVNGNPSRPYLTKIWRVDATWAVRSSTQQQSLVVVSDTATGPLSLPCPRVLRACPCSENADARVSPRVYPDTTSRGTVVPYPCQFLLTDW